MTGNPIEQMPKKAEAVSLTLPGRPTRRHAIVISALSFVCVGAIASAWPLIASLGPDAASVKPFVDVDVGDLAPRTVKTVAFGGRPVWVRRWSYQSPWIVTSAVCSRCGCVMKTFEIPAEPAAVAAICPCCASKYDFAGKRTAPSALPDLDVIPFTQISGRQLRLGGA